MVIERLVCPTIALRLTLGPLYLEMQNMELASIEAVASTDLQL
jgi:hypothetical protein